LEELPKKPTFTLESELIAKNLQNTSKKAQKSQIFLPSSKNLQIKLKHLQYPSPIHLWPYKILSGTFLNFYKFCPPIISHILDQKSKFSENPHQNPQKFAKITQINGGIQQASHTLMWMKTCKRRGSKDENPLVLQRA